VESKPSCTDTPCSAQCSTESPSKHRKSFRKLSAEQRKEAENGLTTVIQHLLADETKKINNIALEHGV
jgi:hypothetical protein